jgi:hypothetical protein
MQCPYRGIALVLLFALSAPSFGQQQSDHDASRNDVVLPPIFKGVWILAEAANNTCSRNDWETRGQRKYDFRLIHISDRSIEGWEIDCDIIHGGSRTSTPEGRHSITVDTKCDAEGMSWRATEMWDAQVIGNRRNLVKTTVKVMELRDPDGKLLPESEFGEQRSFNYLECK